MSQAAQSKKKTNNTRHPSAQSTSAEVTRTNRLALVAGDLGSQSQEEPTENGRPSISESTFEDGGEYTDQELAEHAAEPQILPTTNGALTSLQTGQQAVATVAVPEEIVTVASFSGNNDAGDFAS